MFGILTEQMSKCQGRYGVQFAAAVLADECQQCLRRTWPDPENRLGWIKTPTDSPCSQRIPPYTVGDDTE